MLFSTSHTSPGEALHCVHMFDLLYNWRFNPLTVDCLHHDRYWLWYTTQRCVSGMVRKIYQKLKLFKVQFLSLQRKTDPSQVLLQCLPANKVWVLRSWSLFVSRANAFMSINVHDNCCMWCLYRSRSECSLCQNSTMDRSLQICATCWKESSFLQALRGA